jgi:hypothetical protein
MCLWNTNSPREWQIPLTAMPMLKLLKSRSNAKVKKSNHLFLYSSNITTRVVSRQHSSPGSVNRKEAKV